MEWNARERERERESERESPFHFRVPVKSPYWSLLPERQEGVSWKLGGRQREGNAKEKKWRWSSMRKRWGNMDSTMGKKRQGRKKFRVRMREKK